MSSTHTAAIEITDVTKSFGPVYALRGVSMAIARGSIFGLVGPNGAGKTTLFSVMTGFLRPDSGSIALGGQPVQVGVPNRTMKMTILPQDAGFMKHMPIEEHLVYYARLDGMDKSMAQQEADRVLRLVQLADVKRRTVDTLSHGMRKRVGVAQAFLGRPDVIILDEPTAGLDPHAAREIYSQIRTISEDQTIIVSSHNLAEVEDLCDEVAILSQGTIVRQDSLKSLVGEAAEVTFRMVSKPSEAVMDALKGLDWIVDARWEDSTGRVQVSFDGDKRSHFGWKTAPRS